MNRKLFAVFALLAALVFVTGASAAPAGPGLPAAEPSGGLLVLFGITFLALAVLGRKLGHRNDPTKEAEMQRDLLP